PIAMRRHISSLSAAVSNGWPQFESTKCEYDTFGACERLKRDMPPRSLSSGRLVAQALPQSWDCKIKEGTQLQRDLTLARVDNADRHRRWLIRLQQSD